PGAVDERCTVETYAVVVKEEPLPAAARWVRIQHASILEASNARQQRADRFFCMAVQPLHLTQLQQQVAAVVRLLQQTLAQGALSLRHPGCCQFGNCLGCKVSYRDFDTSVELRSKLPGRFIVAARLNEIPCVPQSSEGSVAIGAAWSRGAACRYFLLHHSGTDALRRRF